MADGTAIYETSAVSIPTFDELTSLSQELRLNCTTEDLHAAQGHFQSIANAIQEVCKLQPAALPVKYPRTPGYRPSQDENPFNAWYWRCDIKGTNTGKLAGKTIGVKDNIAVAGVPMMNGSKLLEGYTPEFDATVVTRILDAGGRIVGKTACENFCFDGSSYSSATGPVRNPHDETRTSGGSSSGSGALVSAGKIDMALGGDQGGSIRIPASWCGIVGLKPTHGLVPYTGAMAVDPTVDHLGPMARTVEDCALLLEVLAGYDEGLDPRQNPQLNIPEYTKLLDKGISGKRIGLLKEGFENCHDPAVVDIVKDAADRLKETGAFVEEVSIPMHSTSRNIWLAFVHQGGYQNIASCGGAAQFNKGFYPTSLQEAVWRGFHARPYDVTGFIKCVCLTSEYIHRYYGNKFYSLAKNQIIALTREVNNVLEKFDVLFLPTMLFTAPKLPLAGATTAEIVAHSSSISLNTSTFNLTGHPALSINAGYSKGLPVGMQIVGRHFDETSVLQVARVYEKIRDASSGLKI